MSQRILVETWRFDNACERWNDGDRIVCQLISSKQYGTIVTVAPVFTVRGFDRGGRIHVTPSIVAHMDGEDEPAPINEDVIRHVRDHDHDPKGGSMSEVYVYEVTLTLDSGGSATFLVSAPNEDIAKRNGRIAADTTDPRFEPGVQATVTAKRIAS